MTTNSTLQQMIVSKTLDKIVKLTISSYESIKTEPLAIKREDNRRNQLVAKMKSIQNDFGISVAIGNNDVFNSLYTTTGYTDISFIFGDFGSKSIIFECKRVKDDSEIRKSYLQSEYCGEGINRFTSGKYPIELGFAGMISFIESGDCNKWFDLLKKEITGLIDDSAKSGHSYIGSSTHVANGVIAFEMKHIVFNFN